MPADGIVLVFMRVRETVGRAGIDLDLTPLYYHYKKRAMMVLNAQVQLFQPVSGI